MTKSQDLGWKRLLSAWTVALAVAITTMASGATGMRVVAEAELPKNWRNLNLQQKFDALRGSTHLVRGSPLANVTIDCRERNIADFDTGFAMHLNYPGREGGSFGFRVPHGRLVLGDLEVLSSDEARYDRIYVLSGTSSRQNAKKGPEGLTRPELARIAALLETFHNRCSPAQTGRHIDVYAIMARNMA